MNNWILAHGREAERSLADIIPAGARSLALAGAGLIFAPPQKLFISEADGSEAEWLGRVTAATAATLAFSRPLHASKNSGARLWRAASSIEFPPESARIALVTITTGVTDETTSDGTAYAIQTAQPRTELTLHFEELPATRHDELIAWLAAQPRWGLEPFTLITPDGKLKLVRLSGKSLHRECDARERTGLSLPLIQLLEGVYQ